MYSQIATLLGILTLGLLSPGPDFFLIVKNSIGGSRARAFATGWGIVAGLTVQMLALSLGLAFAPPLALRILQLLGAAVLAWIGLKALIFRPEVANQNAASWVFLKNDDATARKHARGQAAAGFSEGFLCNVTNAKAFVFFMSLFSQFITDKMSWSWHVILPVMIVLHAAIMWTLITWALMFPPVAQQLTRVQHWLPRVFGVILIAFAIFIVWETLFASTGC